MNYVENFANGRGGWRGWDNAPGAVLLPLENGILTSRGPWWVDYNHAPPGGGYLHILFSLNTMINHAEHIVSKNRFIEEGFPTDFTNAQITTKIRGEVDLKGSQLVFLVQSNITEPVKTRVCSVLSGQPIPITPDWTESTITCVPDNDQWTCLGSRFDRFETYGWGPIATVLKSVTGNIIFVLWPLDVQPAAPVEGDMHVLRAGDQYQVDTTRLPTGFVSLDEIRIDFS